MMWLLALALWSPVQPACAPGDARPCRADDASCDPSPTCFAAGFDVWDEAEDPPREPRGAARPGRDAERRRPAPGQGAEGPPPPEASRGRRGPELIGPQALDRIIELLRQRRPDLAERLNTLSKSDPELLDALVAEAFAERFERHRGDWRRDRDREPGDDPGAAPPEGDGADASRRPRSPWGESEAFGRRRPGDSFREQHGRLEEEARRIAREHQTRALADADPASLAALRAQLTGVVSQQFDLRSEARLGDIRGLEAKLAKMHEFLDAIREDMERRASDREGIIARRVDELLTGEGDEPPPPDEPGRRRRPDPEP